MIYTVVLKFVKLVKTNDEAKMKHLFVVNPKSFLKETDMMDVIKDIRTYFDSNSDGGYAVHISRYPRDAIRAVKKYIQSTDDIVRVYAVGGDGILYDCLNGMAEFSGAQLATIPYGSFNEFCRVFGDGKEKIFRDIKLQTEAGTVPVDILYLGHKYALSFCVMGVEAFAYYRFLEIRKRLPLLPRKLYKAMLLLGSFLAIADKKTYARNYEITIDGQNYDGKYMAVNISNGGCYGGDMIPAPMAHPGDGMLDIIMIKNISRVRLLSIIDSYTKGKYYTFEAQTQDRRQEQGIGHVNNKYEKFIKHMRCKEIVIRSENPMHIMIDGEMHYDNYIHINVIPGAVEFAAPGGLSYAVRGEGYEQ